MSLEFFIILCTALGAGTLGAIVLLRDYRSATHTSFFALTLVFAAWAMTNYFSLHSDSEWSTLFWIRVVMMITSFLGPLVCVFLDSYPNRRPNLKPWKHYVCFGFACVVAVISMTPFLFASVVIKEGNISPQPGPLFFLYPIDFFCLTGIGLVSIYKKFRRSRGIVRTQISYLFFGTFCTFALFSFTNLVAVVLFHTSQLVFLGPSLSLIMLSCISYAIVKHRLLDIRLILARSLTYLLVVLMSAALYSSGIFIGVTFFAQEKVSSVGLLISLVLSLFITFSFQPIRRYFEKVTERIFFVRTYDSQYFVQQIGVIMASTLVLDDLSQALLLFLRQYFGIRDASIIIFEGEQVIFSRSSGKKEAELKQDSIPTSFIYESARQKIEQILVLEEISESKLKQQMRSSDVSIVLPLIMQGQLIGGLLLSGKQSGQSYFSQEIQMLKVLVSPLAIGVNNALSYEKIHRFNETLAQEVERATRKLKSANERLKELDKLKDEFVSVASHELRTPMTAIKSYLWLALNNSDDPVPPDVQKYLHIAYRSTDRLIQLVQDMLTISRIESKRLELHRSDVPMFELVQQVHEELKVTGDTNHLRFVLEKNKDVSGMVVSGDREKLREVLQNLIGNALKFTPAKGEVRVAASDHNGQVIIHVQDNGPGISEKNLPKLFQKFGKIDSSYAMTKETGTGLGLYISKKIIDLHGGSITVESTVGKGTTFHVILPKNLTKN